MVPPLTLCDERIPPNLQLKDVDFRAEDTTVTSVISMPLVGTTQGRLCLVVDGDLHVGDEAAEGPGAGHARLLARGVREQAVVPLVGVTADDRVVGLGELRHDRRRRDREAGAGVDPGRSSGSARLPRGAAARSS